MNVQVLLDEIKERQNKIKEHKKYISETQQEIAEHECPFKVGDKVISPTGIEEIISRIIYTGYPPMYSFRVFKIKNDGAPYKNDTYAYRIDKYKLAG